MFLSECTLASTIEADPLIYYLVYLHLILMPRLNHSFVITMDNQTLYTLPVFLCANEQTFCVDHLQQIHQSVCIYIICLYLWSHL